MLRHQKQMYLRTPEPQMAPAMRTDELFAFIEERHAIHRRRKAGHPKPWTSNPILQQFRFTNVYRELDTETKWIKENWREPHRSDPDLWFAMVVARLVNWHESLDEIGYPIPWRPDRFVEALEDRRKRGDKPYTGAYMVHADQHFDGPKSAYLAEKVLTPMWNDRASLRRMVRGTLADAHRTLMKYRDMGSFMAGQVIADLKYVPPLRQAPRLVDVGGIGAWQPARTEPCPWPTKGCALGGGKMVAVLAAITPGNWPAHRGCEDASNSRPRYARVPLRVGQVRARPVGGRQAEEQISGTSLTTIFAHFPGNMIRAQTEES